MQYAMAQLPNPVISTLGRILTKLKGFGCCQVLAIIAPEEGNSHVGNLWA
tara:strand:+ start:821 stop:970 length:150 start_codon:yes stop_codon:yes gene_type:complete